MAGALTAQQIVTLACQTARTPGWTAQAGQLFNSILSDLCQTYNLDITKKTYNFNFNVGVIDNAAYPNLQAGCGPYEMPADYLRAVKNEVMWFNQGVPYPMIPCDLSEYDWLVQQAGNQAYPFLFATDVSQTPPVAVVWPGASGAYPVMVRYYSQMPAIDTPETSSEVPWFPNSRYLLKQLSGMLMELADDARAQTYLGDGDPNNPGAGAILKAFLKEVNDNDNRAKTVMLDRRRFSRPFNRLPNTKRVGF